MRLLHFSKTLCCLAFFLAFAASGDSQVYQWQENNKTYFSDKPHPNAKIIPIKATLSYYTVKKVLDGDTIILDENTHIRLLGINTPEVGGRFKSTEAGGERAKQWLKQQLQGQRVRLETDVEKQDRYKRTLAHIFTETGLHMNLELVRNGLATASIYPPNLNYSNALIAAEQLAERHQLGIWQEAAYSVKTVTSIDESVLSGWQRICGTPKSIHTSSRYAYLDFNNDFSIRIARDNLSLFPDLKTYLGHQVEVRGWINQQQSGYSLLIRHPHAIKITSN